MYWLYNFFNCPVYFSIGRFVSYYPVQDYSSECRNCLLILREFTFFSRPSFRMRGFAPCKVYFQFPDYTIALTFCGPYQLTFHLDAAHYLFGSHLYNFSCAHWRTPLIIIALSTVCYYCRNILFLIFSLSLFKEHWLVLRKFYLLEIFPPFVNTFMMRRALL